MKKFSLLKLGKIHKIYSHTQSSHYICIYRSFTHLLRQPSSNETHCTRVDGHKRLMFNLKDAHKAGKIQVFMLGWYTNRHTCFWRCSG